MNVESDSLFINSLYKFIVSLGCPPVIFMTPIPDSGTEDVIINSGSGSGITIFIIISASSLSQLPFTILYLIKSLVVIESSCV